MIHHTLLIVQVIIYYKKLKFKNKKLNRISRFDININEITCFKLALNSANLKVKRDSKVTVINFKLERLINFFLRKRLSDNLIRSEATSLLTLHF